jgi:peptide-methionine (S)-S-oxide reductase
MTTAGAHAMEVPAGREVATLAGGCFWCTEAVFTELKGVERVVPGYSGGTVEHPTYRQVCAGTTGHAEAVQIVFDPTVISFRDLVEIFLTTHDPTTLNRQGPDVGTQYRSAIFYHSDAQRKTAEEVIRQMSDAGIWHAPIVTEVTPFHAFYEAEDYHHEYFRWNGDQPYCRVVVAPKVAKFREHYRDRLKNKAATR